MFISAPTTDDAEYIKPHWEVGRFSFQLQLLLVSAPGQLVGASRDKGAGGWVCSKFKRQRLDRVNQPPKEEEGAGV